VIDVQPLATFRDQHYGCRGDRFSSVHHPAFNESGIAAERYDELWHSLRCHAQAVVEYVLVSLQDRP
jgi:hypothetical protein